MRRLPASPAAWQRTVAHACWRGARGLAATAALWPDLQTAYAWVHHAAHLLATETGRSAEDIRQPYPALLTDGHYARISSPGCPGQGARP